ncbi:MAG: hypothetical protein NTV70_14565 [Acidobacteria bacterium]|nr:hypothetical protein [Acidobacteriota bacterium]
MSMILELPNDVEAALASQARAAQMPTEQYLAQLVERALDNRRQLASEHLGSHLAEMAELVLPGTTPAQMEAALDEALDAIRPQRNWVP